MQYIIVSFPDSRLVSVNDVEAGLTNTVIRIGAGKHAFSLGAPTDYEPSEIIEIIDNTNVNEPAMIKFSKKSQNSE